MSLSCPELLASVTVSRDHPCTSSVSFVSSAAGVSRTLTWEIKDEAFSRHIVGPKDSWPPNEDEGHSQDSVAGAIAISSLWRYPLLCLLRWH